MLVGEKRYNKNGKTDDLPAFNLSSVPPPRSHFRRRNQVKA
jgi:hypothetical protein